MPSLYDQIDVKGSTRYRLNKMFVGKDKVPQHVKDNLTFDNIVDENGLIVVDEKNPAAKEPTEDNKKELEEGSPKKLERVDDGDVPKTPVQVDASEEAKIDDPEKDPVDPSDPAADQDVADEPDSEPLKVPELPEPRRTRRTNQTAVNTPRFKSKVPQSSPGMGFPRKNGRTVDIFDLVTPHTHTKFVGGHAVPLSQDSFRSRSEGEIIRRLQKLGIEVIDINDMQRNQEATGPSPQPAGLIMDDDEQEEDIKLG